MKKIVTTLIDDLDPTGQTPAVETVSFALDGTTYEIDLSAANAHTLRAFLKEFKQAGRIITTRTSRRPRPPEPTPGADVDTADITAWAIDKGLRQPSKRGRIPDSIKQAYAASRGGDDAPLHELRALIMAMKPDTATNEAAQADDERLFAEPTSDTITQDEAAEFKEVEARQHYRPVTRHPRMAEDKKWKHRTGYGCERTQKIADMTLVERVEALSDVNLSTLRMLAGIAPLKNGKVSRLSSSNVRLENFEVIEYAPDSPHGWVVTNFGKYALEVRSMA